MLVKYNEVYNKKPVKIRIKSIKQAPTFNMN